jgi:hypothetical protein
MEPLSWGGGAGEKGTHVVRWGMRVYPCSQFCVVGVFVLWEMHFTYICMLRYRNYRAVVQWEM